MSDEPDEETIERRSQNAEATFAWFFDALAYGCLPVVGLVLAPTCVAIWLIR